MTYREYRKRWATPGYGKQVKRIAIQVESDGCTGVPDFYRYGCYEHDISYRTGLDPLGFRTTKREADKRLRWYIQLHSPLGRFSPMSWWRWFAVHQFGVYEPDRYEFPFDELEDLTPGE